jgi:probable HAF family extracellular repeat protein
MKSHIVSCGTAMTLFAMLAIPARLPAQEQTGEEDHAKHHRYKLVDIGTFGGPQSGDFGEDAQPLNRRGVVVGMADTSTRDPNYPNCFPAFPVPDCFVQHAFKWQNGVLTDMGALPGVNTSQADWVNASGVSVGVSTNSSIDPLTRAPAAVAVVWKDGEIANLGTLGGYESTALAINDRGQIAGFATNAIPDPVGCFGFGAQCRAFLWQDGVMQDLGTLGGPDALAGFVNNRGQVVGVSYTNSTPNPTTGSPTQDPFFWEDGKMVDIGSLGGTFGNPQWVNRRGQVVGASNLVGDLTEHPFLWDRGVLTDLGTLGGSFGLALWINDEGVVVGAATNENDQALLAFLWKNGHITNLGALHSDPCSIAWAINGKGQVVGSSRPKCESTHEHAFLWENGQMIDLNIFVPPDSGLTLTEPHYINNRGEITGLGVLRNGDFRAFLLIPCDGDASDAEGCEDEGAAAETQRGSASRTRSANASQSRLSREILAELRARWARRYHFPGLGTPRN